MSLMSDASAFQARGPAMEKALLVTRRRVRETTKLPRSFHEPFSLNASTTVMIKSVCSLHMTENYCVL